MNFLKRFFLKLWCWIFGHKYKTYYAFIEDAIDSHAINDFDFQDSWSVCQICGVRDEELKLDIEMKRINEDEVS